MIEILEIVHQAGVLDGFAWKARPLTPFGRFNIIYGWNASGKTTLSRIFSLLEKNGVSRLPADARARFRIGGHSVDTRSAVSSDEWLVRVFNRDFIDDNLSDHTSAPALLIVGSDNIRLNERIATLGRRRAKVAEMYRAAQKNRDEISKTRERLATQLATACGTALGIRNFRSPDLKATASAIQDKALDHFLNSDALQVAVATARDQAEYRSVREPMANLPSKLVNHTDLHLLLSTTPQQQALKQLSENKALSDWVRNGLQFHEHVTTCAFCGGDASSSLAAYEKHFSDEYQRQHAAIVAILHSLDRSEAAPELPHEKDLIPSLRERFQSAAQRCRDWYSNEVNLRNRWRIQLENKLQNMSSSLVVEPRQGQLDDLALIITELNAIASEHNRASREAADLRVQAIDKVKRHFSVQYILDPESINQARSLESAEECLERISRIGSKIRILMDAAQAQLQLSSVAAGEINRLLRLILGSRVSVQQAENRQLLFMRGNAPATNLSDGEKTAVSLAYFLVSLRQHGRSLHNTIAFIDDPICSLDANHIYDVAYLLLSELRDCKQLFISTHSSEFFNTIKQEWTDRGKFKTGHQGYLMHRQEENKSQLLDIPSHLVKFRSDYHHVFYCLMQLRENASENIETFLHCPNLIRRFLEMYLGFRIPKSAGFQSKLSFLFDDQESRNAIARFADEGSHSQSTLRLLEFSDFPAMARGMTDRLLSALESKDPQHYAALTDAIK